MDNTGITPVMPMGNSFGGDGSWIFLFAILAMMWGGNGFWGGNSGNTNAIQADVNRGFDNQNLQAQTRDILSAVTSGTAQTIAASTQNAANAITAIKDGNASLIREFGNVETALTALGGELQSCCCTTNRNIDSLKFEGAQNTALINATTTAQTQKILDALAQNKIEALQSRVNQLELQNAVSGVVKYPSSMTYAYNSNPFCSCGCGNGNI